MKWYKGRVWLLVAGATFSLYGLAMLHSGIFVFRGARGNNYSGGMVATGVFVCLLAFLPPVAWIDRWVARRKNRKELDHPAYHHRHHGPK